MLPRKSAKPPTTTEPHGQAPSPELRAAQEALEQRDATIRRLETALADERDAANTARDAADALRFKAEVLEKSYAKQLADARQKVAAAEKTLAEHREQIAAFGANREDTIRLLKEARSELEAVKLDRDQIKRQLARGPASMDRTPLTIASDSTAAEGTINELMANAAWLKDPKRGSASHLEAKVGSSELAAPEVMLAPELVFTKKDEADD
jgi:chromosome segregation ATPase